MMRRRSSQGKKLSSFDRAVGRTAHGPKLLKGKLWPFVDTANCGRSKPCPHLRSVNVGIGRRPLKFVNGSQTKGRRCNWTRFKRRVKDRIVFQALHGAGKMVDAKPDGKVPVIGFSTMT